MEKANDYLLFRKITKTASVRARAFVLASAMALVGASEQMFGQPSARTSAVYSSPFAAAASGAHMSNYTSASHFATPYYYELERDPRQWLSGLGGAGAAGYGYSPFSYGGSSLFSGGGGMEAAVICLLVVVGIGVVGLPMLLMLFSMFNNNMSNAPSGGFNFIPPTSTTTVTGRRRRSADAASGQATGSIASTVDRFARRLVEMGRLNELGSMLEINQLADQLLRNVRPELRNRAMEHLKNFAASKDKLQYIQKLMQQQ